MGEGNFLDIILLAMVAAFVFLRLRSVLGRRTGHERRRGGMLGMGGNQDEGKVVQLPERGKANGADANHEAAQVWADDSPAGAGLTRIKIADPGFEPETFVDGSRAAYEMIVSAYASGDRESLRMLLADEVYENFVGAIDEREAQGQTQESTIVSLDDAEIVDADLNGRIAEVTVKFTSQMSSALLDAQGEVLPGQSTAPREVTDVWTFGRDTGSGDPNWQLIETRSED